MKFYIYLHLKPNGDPFYVGKGTLYRTKDLNKRNQHHKNIVAKHGAKNVEILIFPRETEQMAFDDEVKWIQVLREAGYELSNKTNGGEGTSGRILSLESRNKMSASAMGNQKGIGNKSRTGQTNSLETNRKGAISRTGKKRAPFSKEHLANLSDSHKGKKYPPRSAEHRANLSASHIGIIFSDEHRANLSIAAKARYAR
jgi:hypothetical protein